MNTKVTGLILAGGENSRIGLNKACLKLGEKTFIEHIAAALRPFCEEIIIVVPRFIGDVVPQLIGELQCWEEGRVREMCRVIPTISKAGPMAGVWTGLNAARTEFVFCAACDIPFIHPGIVAEVISAITPGIQAVVPKYRGFWEPLCAAYAKSCLQPIQDSLSQKDYKIQSLFENLNVKEIEEAVLVKHDPEGHTFFNINCLADYQKAKEIYCHQITRCNLAGNIAI